MLVMAGSAGYHIRVRGQEELILGVHVGPISENEQFARTHQRSNLAEEFDRPTHLGPQMNG